MPLRDTDARAASLANDLGPTRGANSPDTYKVALFLGDPSNGGVEVNNTDCPGYVRADVDVDDFAATDLGMQVNATFADPTAAWTQEPTHWQLLDAADVSVGWDNGALTEPLSVTGAGDGPLVVLTVFYADSVDDLT